MKGLNKVYLLIFIVVVVVGYWYMNSGSINYRSHYRPYNDEYRYYPQEPIAIPTVMPTTMYGGTGGTRCKTNCYTGGIMDDNL